MTAPTRRVCVCGEPLIPTFAFSGSEYACVVCGRTFAMFGADSQPDTPALVARYEELLSVWQENTRGLLSGGVMLRTCSDCSRFFEPHICHASPDELAAHERALAWFRALRPVNA